MKQKITLQKRIQSFKRFIAVNLFVQKLRLKAFGLRWYIIDIVGTLVQKGKPVLETFLLGFVINEVQRYVLHSTTSLDGLYQLLGIILFERLTTSIFVTYYVTFIGYKIDFSLPDLMEKEIMNKLIYLNWEHIEEPQMEKNIQMAYNRSLGYVIKLSELHIDLVVLIFTVIPTFAFANIPLWVIVLSTLKQVPSIILAGINVRLSHKINDKTLKDWQIVRAIFAYFRNLKTLLEIKVSQGYNSLLGIYKQKKKDIETEHMSVDKKLLLPWILTEIYEVIINTGISIYYIVQVLFFGMLFGTYQYTTGIISQASVQIYSIITKINNSVDYYHYIAYLYNIVNQQNKYAQGTKKLDTEEIIIEFKDVWFKYPGATKYSLKNINMVISDNARLAIVGENGAGKSTFLKLLNGLYRPTKGDILVNGTPLHEYSIDDYRKKIAMVTQEFAQYGSLTVADNITIYEHSLNLDKSKIEKAAKLAEAYEFIQKLSHKFETVLTKTIEDGTELSTGQWQRIAIARQFYANRAVIILDEPTSAIDPIGESRIFNNLYSHLEKKTVIVVSHRYNTVRSAKEIIVFNNAEIIERGTHDQLLALKGYYAEAYRVQQEEKKL